MSNRVRFGVSLLLTLSIASAQVVVDPSGGGSFRDLQTAIDAVPAGTVLKVVGGTYGPLKIKKSVTIAGAPAPTIRSPDTGSGPSQPPAIELAGIGSNRLILQNVRVGGQVNGASYALAGPGIAGAGFASLQIYSSVVTAHEWTNLTGGANGVPAISLAGAVSIVISGSGVTGSLSDSDPSGTGWAPNGPPGIQAPLGTIIALDSTITGGGSGRSQFQYTPPDVTPCPCAYPAGNGGPAVLAATLFEVGSILRGGSGCLVYWRPGPTLAYRPWGQQPSGAQFQGTSRVAIPLTMLPISPPRVGQPWSLELLVGASPPGVLYFGTGLDAPLAIGPWWIFVNPALPAFALPLPNISYSIGLPIPANPALGGAAICFQFLSTSSQLSNPVQVAIGF